MLLKNVKCINILLKITQRFRDLHTQRNKEFFQTALANGYQPLQHVKEGVLDQPLDHFNRQNINTFRQRFLVNEEYWQRPEGPVFLFVGGEGPILRNVFFAGHHVDMAKEHGALLLAVEHRFYGDSINPDGLETENLAYLSSQQALVLAFPHFLPLSVCVCV
uniref:Thymus-specific serine protease-like n=1 Tax=Cyprinodon variegatus TaxID=28743 RepID=A0A3Q2CTQ0_CYPVA